jgi:hypothetical protein
LLKGVRRPADDGGIAEDTSHGGNRKIVLPDVDAIGAGQPGQVGAIVHDEEGVTFTSGRRDLARQVKESAAGKTFGAKLKKAGAAGEIGMRQIDRPPTRAFGDVYIDDRVEPWESQSGDHHEATMNTKFT